MEDPFLGVLNYMRDPIVLNPCQVSLFLETSGLGGILTKLLPPAVFPTPQMFPRSQALAQST